MELLSWEMEELSPLVGVVLVSGRGGLRGFRRSVRSRDTGGSSVNELKDLRRREAGEKEVSSSRGGGRGRRKGGEGGRRRTRGRRVTIP